MADNVQFTTTVATPPSTTKVGTDKVTYSGDSDVDIQLVRVVETIGAEGSKTVVSSKPGTGTTSSVSGNASSVTLLSANTSRIGAVIVNDSSAVLYIKFGTTASATDYTYKLNANQTLELPTPCFTGRVDGIWASATGAARITELT